ncbi:MAG TPA: hypothetical protein VN812_21680 [Candidatus Acidoferrales bacterium]|nr:hypothetical protein [Candidatus Acidoferrales bacterium]
MRRPHRQIVVDGDFHSAAIGDNTPRHAGALTMALALVVLNRLAWKRLYRLANARFSWNR